ncbi:hypothetical protein Dimus_036994 [Dionaea muscipula]
MCVDIRTIYSIAKSVGITTLLFHALRGACDIDFPAKVSNFLSNGTWRWDLLDDLLPPDKLMVLRGVHATRIVDAEEKLIWDNGSEEEDAAKAKVEWKKSNVRVIAIKAVDFYSNNLLAMDIRQGHLLSHIHGMPQANRPDYFSWRPPDQGFLKIHTDESCKAWTGMASIGALARNEDGKWVVGISGSFYLASVVSV